MEQSETEYSIRVPIDVVQFTFADGTIKPLAFRWCLEVTPEGQFRKIDEVVVEIQDVLFTEAQARQKSGIIGDRYECLINGMRESLYFGRLAPRKWFRDLPVSKAAYENYYRLPATDYE